jgi:hypothetical protein
MLVVPDFFVSRDEDQEGEILILIVMEPKKSKRKFRFSEKIEPISC